MSEISFKSIFDGVSLALHAAFPAVQVHGGNVKQGLNPGDLNVVMPSAGQSRQVGERFLRTPTLDVIYYPKVGAAECCEMADQLIMLLRDITTPEGDLIHCTNSEWTIEEGVLHVMVSYDHHIYIPQEPVLMETLDIEMEGYREKVLAMPGVGDLKIHPVWNGDISPASLIPGEEVESWYSSIISTLSGPVAAWLTAVYTAAKEKKLTVGGTVKLVIMASDYKTPTPTLLEEIQTAIDPEQNAGEGLGLAPIGHVVHVTGVTAEKVDIELHLTYASDWSWEAVKSYVEAVIDAYFVELSQDWASSDFLTVRISQIESRILAECSSMITDIGGTKINGQESNLALGPDSIPSRGEVTDG